MKNNYDLSVVIAGIRPHLWEDTCNSLFTACGKYNFEIIFVGPFAPPMHFIDGTKIRFIQDFGQVSRAAQIGAWAASGELFFSTTDDVLFIRNSIENTIDFYKENCSKYDVIGMRYREVAAGRLFFHRPVIGPEGFPEYLASLVDRVLVTNSPPFKNEPYTPDYWFYPTGEPVAIQVFMDLAAFKEVGGWDCRFEYLLEPAVDLCRRLKNLGGKIVQSPVEISLAEFYPGHLLDHKPIHDSANLEKQLREALLAAEPDRTIIEFDNWRQSPETWSRRFPTGKVNTYDEMMKVIGGKR